MYKVYTCVTKQEVKDQMAATGRIFVDVNRSAFLKAVTQNTRFAMMMR